MALYLLGDTGYPLAQSPGSVKFLVAYAWIKRPRDGSGSRFSPYARRFLENMSSFFGDALNLPQNAIPSWRDPRCVHLDLH